MKSSRIREKYIEFFKSTPREHVEISPSSLVLEDDPTTLFTSSGMQQLVPYLAGEPHPKGKRLVDSQPCFRSVDIEEVGDNRHTTFFEMLGNWSLGDYFKEGQLSWIWKFLTKEIGLSKDRLYITVFEGTENVPKDEESVAIWEKLGVPKEKIFYYGVGKNWWSRTGSPKDMPPGEIGGPDSEVFFEFTEVEHDPKYGDKCHPNCECGRFLEIANSVFIQYRKRKDGGLEELPQKNVDFGGGLERMVAAVADTPDVFEADLFSEIIKSVEEATGKSYEGESRQPFRIIADHIKGAVFIADAGIQPSNKEHGYILRRLIRRAAVKLRSLKGSVQPEDLDGVVDAVFVSYKDNYLKKDRKGEIKGVVKDEVGKFKRTLERGLKEVEKIDKIDAKKAFDLYQSYGFPLEITTELFSDKGQTVDRNKFKKEFEKHKEKSRASSTKFKGGLADTKEETVKLHTATHLLHAALRKVLGEHVVQKGSNITSERLRFDFPHDSKLTDDEIEKVEKLINQKVDEDLPVKRKVMPLEEAKKTAAIQVFGEKYGDEVSIYYIGESMDSAFSKEFCGGPHVESTGKIGGRVRIERQKSIGSGLVRIYAKIEPN